MYNPDFWEVQLDPVELDRYPAEAGIWFEMDDEPDRRSEAESPQRNLLGPVMDVIATSLTQRQREAMLLYFLHHKTQEEVAEILGISRRVVSQHLFGICRNGKHVGGAINKLRKVCRHRGIWR